MKHAPLTPRQLFWTAFLMMFPTIVLLPPGDLVRLAGRYGWCTPLAAAVPMIPAVWGAGRLAARYGNYTDILLQRLGPIAGRVPLLAVWAALAAYVVVITREFAEVAQATYVFVDVPIGVLTGLGLVVAGLGAWLGITVIARGAEVVAPTLILILVVLSVASLPSAHVLWALPLLPRNARFAGLQPLARIWAFLAEPVALSLAVQRSDRQARAGAGRILAGAVATAAILSAAITWVIIADFGPPRAAELVLPFFNLSKRIALGSFLTHLEVLLIPIILMGGAGKMTICYWLWLCCGVRLTGGRGRDIWLAAGLLGLGTLSVMLFANAVALDEALYHVLAALAMPVLLAGIGIAYATAAARARRAP